jgi:riboflavin synthase
MFTGIITDIGEVIACDTYGDDTHLRIRTAFDVSGIALGASIACSGICLTVTQRSEDWFAVMASAETASITTLAKWAVGTTLNLERALCMGDELGGHIVSGHVDGLATLQSIEPIGESWKLTLVVPPEFSRYIARKGSVTLDGVSLTVNAVVGDQFCVNIIPHTWEHTTLANRKVGDLLNLEIDPIARNAQRSHEIISQQGNKPPRIEPSILAAPKIRQLYWCDFPEDAQLPEFWKRRPVIIISYKNRRHGTVTVIPCSTVEQLGNPWAHPLSKGIDDKQSWAICDKPTTVATSRLIMQRSAISRVREDDFNEILKKLFTWLPTLPKS